VTEIATGKLCFDRYFDGKNKSSGTGWGGRGACDVIVMALF